MILSLQGESVETIVVDGEIVLRDGRCTRIDESEVLTDAEMNGVEIRARPLT